MKNAKYPKIRLRSAPADPDDQCKDMPRRGGPVEELIRLKSCDAVTVEARKARKNLYREAIAIAERYGAFIGRDALYCAIDEFRPTPESFNKYGGLTLEGAEELTRLMGEAIAMYKDYLCRIWRGMTKAEVNVMREVQGLPPV